MTTNKEQQEALRDKFEEFAIARNMCIDEIALEGSTYREYTEQETHSAWLAYQDCYAKLTSQVASGEAVAYLVTHIDENNNVSIFPTLSISPLAKYNRVDPLYLHPPTPSPSNVLVEALQEIWDKYMATGEPTTVSAGTLAYLAKDALATYSAPSADSVSVPMEVEK